ncbi:MAG: adenylosuccinate lyase [Sphaerochaetaceae bacterium]|jgi:adenylosuccinate lyase|nr:adenylosuccinate lyase [Sphaerochaetaceae bacterium]HHU87816.1 adenylosuccinate lyase [Spirochaetales bacterium]
MFNHTTYISPFTWRYGSDQMRALWSEVNKRKTLRKIWIALAEVQSELGLVTAEQVADLVRQKDNIDIERSSEIEKEIHHDLMAEIKCYAEQCPIGGAIIHLGATSMDILDNMDVLRQKEALKLIINLLKEVITLFGDQIERYAELPTIAFTHIQPAEVTTVGYRLAQSAQDLLDDLSELERMYQGLKGKGLKGAVGSSASYQTLLEGSAISPLEFEKRVMEKINLEPFTATTQVYTRKQDWRIGSALAGLCATLAKFALDLRILQSPPIGEWSEPFGTHQVGSSAMPFKRNPIMAEKINSLARFVAAQGAPLWDNAANNILERTLDDSANRRVIFPELFLATEEILLTTKKIIGGLTLHEGRVNHNLNQYALFAATERLLMHLVKLGGDRQVLHEVIREHSLVAWSAIQRGEANPLATLLSNDKTILELLERDEIIALLTAQEYSGDAPLRAKLILKEIRLLEDK